MKRCLNTQVLLRILSDVESPYALHSFFCASRGTLTLAADPVLRASWLTKHRQGRALDLAARKGGADVMICLLRIGAVSATEKVPYAHSSFLGCTPINIAVSENLPEVVEFFLRRGDVQVDVADVTQALLDAARFNRPSQVLTGLPCSRLTCEFQ
jgi:hypothetical protein